jgi:hypothetical protein
MAAIAEQLKRKRRADDRDEVKRRHAYTMLDFPGGVGIQSSLAVTHHVFTRKIFKKGKQNGHILWQEERTPAIANSLDAASA